MYLDLDLHFSDGVSGAFVGSAASSATPQILTLSLHYSAPGFFPASPLADLPDPANPTFDPYTLSLPLMHGASDATFSAVWKTVEAVKEAFIPDYVVVQCGVDGLAGDPCGIWNWSLGTSDGCLGNYIDKICNHWNCKVLLLGGGTSISSTYLQQADMVVIRWLQLAKCGTGMGSPDVYRGTYGSVSFLITMLTPSRSFAAQETASARRGHSRPPRVSSLCTLVHVGRSSGHDAGPKHRSILG